MRNPLLHLEHLPAFNDVQPKHIEPALDKIIADNLTGLDQLLQQAPPYTWDNLMRPMEDMDERLSAMWSVVSHLKAVTNSDALRAAYNTCLPKLSDYSTKISHNEKLYQATKAIAEGPEYNKLSTAQRKVIDDTLRDFRLAGIALKPEDKKRFANLQKQLAKLTSKFEENLLDATQGWTRTVTDEAELAGLPAHAKAAAKEVAQQQNISGWLFTLELPSYLSIMTYADSRSLRQEMYSAFTTRASDQGPNAKRWDNTPLMHEILTVRHEIARLLGFANYAELSLATKMAKTTTEVMDFLQQLTQASLTKAREEFHQLQQFAQQDGISELKAWDVAYYSEKLRQQQFHISQEDLRPYFPEDQVLTGLFAIVKRLYGIDIKEVSGVNTWHKDVRFFEIYDEANKLRGQFYIDLYARLNKRGGAWMDECRARRRLADGSIQTPVAFLTCNFNPPVDNDPALFTHDDVLTLFHEFGHGLQHMLTQIEYADISGINGIPWDAVEVASQFMEHWCWEKEALKLTAKHYKTKTTLTDDLHKKLYTAKNFQSAMQMTRQLEFSLFDFRLHMEYNPNQQNVKPDQIQQILDKIRTTLNVIHIPKFNRFQHSFSHIFGGGYAAGYYSYKWAEVLSSDAFSKFEENGIFDRHTGKQFMQTLLEKGGSEEPLQLFKAFRGRAPKIDALLRHNGII